MLACVLGTAHGVCYFLASFVQVYFRYCTMYSIWLLTMTVAVAVAVDLDRVTVMRLGNGCYDISTWKVNFISFASRWVLSFWSGMR